MTNSSINKKSALIIGATGALGLQLLRHLAKDPQVDEVHVMARTPSKLDLNDRVLATSVQKGNAREPKDIEQALRACGTAITHVILATGNGHDLSKSDTREATGRALATVLIKPEFHHVQAVVMSSHGAGETKVIVGMGIEQFDTAKGNLKRRTLVVRPSSLTDDKPLNDLKGIVEFNGTKKGPTINIDRSDVAAWVTREVATKKTIGGRKICLTNAE
ncbi:MAG: hypothetical protein SGARI_001288 [Bacillariaceae sp.]